MTSLTDKMTFDTENLFARTEMKDQMCSTGDLKR